MLDKYSTNGKESTPEFDEEQVRTYIKMLQYGGLENLYQGVYRKGHGSVYARLGDTDALVELIRQPNQDGYHVYAEMGAMAQKPGTGERAKASTVEGIRGFWMEVDVGDEGHHGEGNPKTLEEAMGILGECPLEPTMIIHSGGGIHAYWMRKNPWVMHHDRSAGEVSAEQRRQSAKNAAKWFGSAFKAAAEGKGYSIDSVGDLARPMRVPGTTNPRHGKLARILKHNPDNVYEMKEFVPFLQRVPEPGTGTHRTGGPTDASVEGTDEQVEKAAEAIAYHMVPDGNKHMMALCLAGLLRGQRGERLDYDTAFATMDRGWTLAGYPRIGNREGLFNPLDSTERKIAAGERVLGGGHLETMAPGLTAKLYDAFMFGEDDGYSLPLTDIGNAERLARRARGTVLYVYSWKEFLAYDGKRFKTGAEAIVDRHAKDVARELLERAKEALAKTDALENADPAKKAAKALWTWAKYTSSRAGLSAMKELLKSEPGIEAYPEDMDSDNYLFNCQNGTLDLRTRELRPHDPADKITKISGANYRPLSMCPHFERFLERIVPDDGVRYYLQRLFGYALGGHVAEHILAVLHGTGNNGKTTLMNAVSKVFGEYAIQAAPELLIAKKGSHPTELADLYHTRFVASVEIEGGQRLDEARVKAITGNDPIRARKMRQDFWQFDPTHTTVMAVNHRPLVRGSDVGTWRRLKLVPLTETISDNERDKHLDQKLSGEADGILTWLVEGYMAWTGPDGLDVPEVVRIATEDYKSEMDSVGAFLDETFIFGRHFVSFDDLYIAWQVWAKRNGEFAMSGKALGQELKERGYESAKHRGERGRWGLKLDSHWSDLVRERKENDMVYGRT
jgi:putative DNA primase/helicase